MASLYYAIDWYWTAGFDALWNTWILRASVYNERHLHTTINTDKKICLKMNAFYWKLMLFEQENTIGEISMNHSIPDTILLHQSTTPIHKKIISQFTFSSVDVFTLNGISKIYSSWIRTKKNWTQNWNISKNLEPLSLFDKRGNY